MRRVDLDHFKQRRFVVQLVNGAQSGILFSRSIARPISGGGNHEHGTRRHESADLQVRRPQAQARRILARRASLHDGRNHIDRRRVTNAVVDGGGEEGLRAAAGLACHGDPPGVDLRQ